MKLDAIAAVEACYAPATNDELWLEGVLRALKPLDRGLGLYATRFDASAPDRVRFHPKVVMLDANEAWAAEALKATFEGDPATVRALYKVTRPVALASQQLRNSPAPLPRPKSPPDPMRDGLDVLGVFAHDVDMRGVLIGIPLQSRAGIPGPRLRHGLAAIAAHLTAARRLRAVAPGMMSADTGFADAVLDPSGRVSHACGEATMSQARQVLGRAVRAIERARGSARRVAAHEALELWQGLVAGTWSLVESVDTDGKRFVLARRNAPGVREPKALTPRERDVLAYAALGHPNKYIAYLLGLGPSTIAGHLASAQRKLGLRSRSELIRTFARPV